MEIFICWFTEAFLNILGNSNTKIDTCHAQNYHEANLLDGGNAFETYKNKITIITLINNHNDY